MKAKIILFLASIFLLVSSCDLLDCTQGEVSYLRMSICDSQDNTVVLPDTLTITTCGIDSVLVNKDMNISEILLPLSYHALVDTFVMHYSGEFYAITETLFVSKTNNIYFESPDCPTLMMHTILSASCTQNLFDSVKVVSDKINFEETTHLKLFVQE